MYSCLSLSIVCLLTLVRIVLCLELQLFSLQLQKLHLHLQVLLLSLQRIFELDEFLIGAAWAKKTQKQQTKSQTFYTAGKTEDIKSDKHVLTVASAWGQYTALSCSYDNHLSVNYWWGNLTCKSQKQCLDEANVVFKALLSDKKAGVGQQFAQMAHLLPYCTQELSYWGTRGANAELPTSLSHCLVGLFI